MSKHESLKRSAGDDVSARSATRKVVVTHCPGLHARPCLAIVNLVRQYQSQIQICNGNQVADAAEILQVMSLGVPQGTEVTLRAQGQDAEQAVDALAQLIVNNFGFAD